MNLIKRLEQHKENDDYVILHTASGFTVEGFIKNIFDDGWVELENAYLRENLVKVSTCDALLVECDKYRKEAKEELKVAGEG